ncbi:hypothetical protein L1887_63058 [Cichorium endivia]|nr:hypothetical protein L1887_63058 [Cichorium endivia]
MLSLEWLYAIVRIAAGHAQRLPAKPKHTYHQLCSLELAHISFGPYSSSMYPEHPNIRSAAEEAAIFRLGHIDARATGSNMRSLEKRTSATESDMLESKREREEERGTHEHTLNKNKFGIKHTRRIVLS